MIYGDTITLKDVEYKVLGQAGDYDYSWNESALLQAPSGDLFYAADSGCSCNSFGDYDVDLVPVKNWQEAVELAKADLMPEHLIQFASRFL